MGVFRIPGGDQGGSGGEQGVRGPWAGPEAGRGSGWWGSVGHSLRNSESRLGEGFEAARWPWAVSKRRVSPVIRTHCKVHGGGLGPRPGAANDLPWGLSWSPWSPSHWPPATLSQASGPEPWDGSVLRPGDSSSCQGDLQGVIRGHFVWTEGCGMQERGRGLMNSESPSRSRAQAREEYRGPLTNIKAEGPIAQDFGRTVAF